MFFKTWGFPWIHQHFTAQGMDIQRVTETDIQLPFEIQTQSSNTDLLKYTNALLPW